MREARSRCCRVGLGVGTAGLLCACLRPAQEAAAPDIGRIPEADPPGPAAAAVFVVDSKPFCFVGANNPYLSFKSADMVEDVFARARSMGLKVMRTWAFEERGSLDGSVPSVDGDGTKEGMYFQYWDTAQNEVAFNDGASGLERLDQTLATAASHGLKLTLVLTNNWRDFGGMDQYVQWFGLPHHHSFYTDERARGAYKSWVRHVVERTNSITGVAYRDDPAIFAWELANQPRCGNGGPFDDTSECTSGVITEWAREMSSYIKSLDKNHLVAVGDEGFFQREDGRNWLYDGANGVDHEALLRLESVDFGTFHLYPDHFGQSVEWGNAWVREHLLAARNAFKPTVLEEYGVQVERNSAGEVTAGLERRQAAYSSWNQAMLTGGGAGTLFWMLAGRDPRESTGYYRDHDQLAIYNHSGDASAGLLSQFASRFPSEAEACTLATRAEVVVPNSPFVQVAAIPPARGELVDDVSPPQRQVPAEPPVPSEAGVEPL